MENALNNVGVLGNHVPCDQAWVSCPEDLPVYNPATLELVGRVRTYVPEQVPQLLSHARIAQATWMKKPVSIRKKLLQNLVHYMVAHLDEIAYPISHETGKPKLEAINSDVLAGISAASYSVESISGLQKKKTINMGKIGMYMTLLGRKSSLYYRWLS